MRSRVIPGSSPTIDRREPVSRLNSVDLPTLGRPQIAISGDLVSIVAIVPWLRRLSVLYRLASSSASRQSRSSSPTSLAGRETAVSKLLGARVVSPRSVFRPSCSGERFGSRFSFSDSACFAPSSLRLRGATAPIVGATFVARPFLGLVLACRCFLPNRFLSFRATERSSFLPQPIGGKVVPKWPLSKHGHNPVYYRNERALPLLRLVDNHSNHDFPTIAQAK